MRLILRRTARQAAATLLTVLIICSILCASVVGYLSLVEQQNLLSARSQAWNMAITIVEAGIEEGLQQLNSNFGDLSANGWSFNGTTYSRTRTLPNGDSYTVTIDATTTPNNPTVVARATVNPPQFARSSPSTFFATIGLDNPAGPTSVTRAVRVRTARGSLFIKALVAKHTIDLNGNNVMTDSFDSTDPAYSTNGHYDPSKTKDKGDVASNDNIVNAVNVGNANIYGHVATGPGGTVAVGSQGGVGEHSWQASHRGEIQPGWSSDDMNFTFPETSTPFTTGFAPTNGNLIIASYSLNSNATTTTTCPSPLPASGVTTNYGSVTVSTPPSPLPASLTTNTSYTTATGLPTPMPDSVVTNVITTTTTTSGYPADGTYLGGVTTNYHSHTISSYTYSLITGYTYTYPVYSYTYPSFTYTYSLYQTNVTYTTNHYDNIIGSGDYVATNLHGSTIVLGNARLSLPDGLSMSGNDTFTVAQGASIKVYSGGTSSAVGGNGVINPSGFAGNFVLYLASTVTSFALNGNGGFVGVLVAPDTDISLNGGGSSSTTDFTGAMIVKSAKLNGHFNVHYDEALEKMPSNGRFLITAWDEIR